MKKVMSALFALVVLASMCVLTSCGSSAPSNEEVKKVVDKHDEGEELTEGDYSIAVDYLVASFEEALPIMKKINDAQNDGDFEKAKKIKDEEIAKLEEKYKYTQDVLFILEGNCHENIIGEKNYKKIEDLRKKFKEEHFTLDI